MTRNITLSRVAAQSHPNVVGELAALLDTTDATIDDAINNDQFSLYEPVPIEVDAPLADVLYIGEHASMFPGVSITSGTQLTYPDGSTGAQMLGYVRQINSTELAAHSARATSWVTNTVSRDWRTSTSSSSGESQGWTMWR